MTMADNVTITDPDALNSAINSYFLKLGVSVDDAFEAACQEVGKEAVKRLKANSPVGRGTRRGHYRDGWKYTFKKTKNGVIESTLHNTKKPGLTQLLEKPHQKIDRSGHSHGSTKGDPHIAPVDAWVQEELPRRISQKIQQKI